MSGKLIVFEGVEGAGKTTQILATAAWLEGIYGQEVSVTITRQPGGTKLGQQIRQLLLEDTDNCDDNSPVEILHEMAELLLYAADRAQHIAAVIQPELDRGNIVLCDRFTDSTIAYQSYGRGIDRTSIERVNNLATGGLESDLTLWLDLDVSIGLERVSGRGKPDRIERASLDFHHRVQQGYQELAAMYPDRIARIDANQPEAVVQSAIQVAIGGIFLEG
jgi:dTMP kinase